MGEETIKQYLRLKHMNEENETAIHFRNRPITKSMQDERNQESYPKFIKVDCCQTISVEDEIVDSTELEIERLSCLGKIICRNCRDKIEVYNRVTKQRGKKAVEILKFKRSKLQ
jgi:hypothetical protein